MRCILLAAALLSLAPLATADKLPEADPAAIRAHTAFLADDLLEGRATGTRGYDIAALYVATQMELMGLKPAGVNGGWLQPVSFVEATRVVPQATAVITRDGESVALEPATDFLPSPSYFSTSSGVTAPMVFVGFGIHAPKYGHDDFGDIDIRGKVAVVLGDSPATLPSSIRAHYSRQMMKEIASRGAVGIVYLETPKSAERSPWEKSVLQATLPRRRLLDDQGQPVEAYPEIKASISVRLEAAGAILAGAPKSLEQVWADAAAGVPQAFELPSSITMTARTELGQAESANVVGLLEGSDPELRNEYVVFTAHLDHLGRGPAVDGDSIYNGALDNASGVAAMLEAARLLASTEPRPKRSILFVAVTGEENGLLGSGRFAQNPTVPKEQLVANVNMDMPVMLYPAAGFVAFGAEHSTLGDLARRAVEGEGLQLVPDPNPEEVFFVRSDQYSFVKEGIPALYLDDAPQSADPAVDAGAVFKQHMVRNYHMPSDDMRLPIHWPSFAKLARINARLGRSIADAAERPAWLPGDFFGETFGRKAP
jgi:Zn-dependent M28 family amino/carboxypeptidase